MAAPSKAAPNAMESDMIEFHPVALKERLGARWRVSEGLDFGREGVFELVHDETDSIILAIVPLPASAPRFALYASVADAVSEKIMRRALERMDFWTGLEGPSLGLRAETGELTMTETAPLTDAQIELLPLMLDDFIAALHALRRECDALEQGDAKPVMGLEA